MTTMLNLYKLDLCHPMAGARIVRTQRYTWPGCYPLALVLDDGCWLCPDCVQDNFAQISWAHRNRQDNGWRPEGYAVIEEANLSTYCSHCGEWILEPEDVEAEA